MTAGSYCTQAAPGAAEAASSKLWLYRSLMTQQTDADSGLVGPIIVTKAASAKQDGSPADVDVELVTLFQVGEVADSGEGTHERARTQALFKCLLYSTLQPAKNRPNTRGMSCNIYTSLYPRNG